MHAEVLLAVGYAVLLLVIAGTLEALARHTAVRSERYRTAGFTYHREHDLWICPRDEPLWPYEVDHERRIVRYRARPSVCNACPVKTDCTPSHTGREVVRAVDPWPHSEAGRFHRAVSVTLTAIAVAFVLAAAAAHHAPEELAVEGAVAAPTGWLLWRWGRDLRRTPSGFPEAAADPAVTRAVARARTLWGFDREGRS